MDRLGALPAITKFTSITIIVGDSNGRQPYLYIEKIVGGVNFCLGLRVDAAINQYVPVSAFQKDIKELTDKPYARSIEDLRFENRIRCADGKERSEIYICRGEDSGKKLDRRAISKISIALGHNREDATIANYIRNI